MNAEIGKNILKDSLDRNRSLWGTARSGVQKDVWHPTPPITVDDVIAEGTAHACPVIYTVLNRPDSLETTWRSYRLKNEAYVAFAELIQNAGRNDLFKDWKKGEQRKRNEKHTGTFEQTCKYPKV